MCAQLSIIEHNFSSIYVNYEDFNICNYNSISSMHDEVKCYKTKIRLFVQVLRVFIILQFLNIYIPQQASALSVYNSPVLLFF